MIRVCVEDTCLPATFPHQIGYQDMPAMKKPFPALALFALSLFVIGVHASGVPEDELKEDGRGIIQDYSNMHEGDDIDWLWVAPGVQLANYRYKLKSARNLTMRADHDLMNVLKNNFPEQLQRAGSRDANAPTLSVDLAVYWAEHANRAKAWIPFSGGHLAQAGVGVECIFRDPDGKIVANIRHAAREGERLEDAGQEVADDIAEYVHAN